MPNRFITTDDSLFDIQNYRNYLLDIATPEVAHDFVTSTFEKFQLLADFPNIGKPRSEIKEWILLISRHKV